MLFIALFLASVAKGPSDTLPPRAARTRTVGFQKIRFQGNRGFSGGTLNPILAMRTNLPVTEDQLDRGVEAVREFYREHGYLDVQAASRVDTVRTKRTLTVSIQEGIRARLRSVVVTSGGKLPNAELNAVLNVKKGDFLDLDVLQTVRQNLLDYCRDHGFYYARCSLETKTGDRGPQTGAPVPTSQTRQTSPTQGLPSPPLVDASFSVTEGPVCYIRNISVRGTQKLKRSLVDRFTEIHPGERYSQAGLISMQRRLYSSRLFDRVYLTMLPADSSDTSTTALMLRTRDTLDVRLDIIESPPHSVDLGAGVQLPPWRALLSAEWENLNVFGEAHTFHATAAYTPLLSRDFLKDYQLNLDLAYGIPYLTSWAINLSTQPFIHWQHEPSWYELDIGAQTGMSHDFTPNLSGQIFNGLRWIRFNGAIDSTQIDSVLQVPHEGRTNSLSAVLTLDTRNDLFSPQRGVYLRPEVDVAGGLLGGSNNFHRYMLDARWFLPLPGGTVLALHGVGGAVLPYGRSTTIPYYEEFYLGGSNSLRGYGEKSIGPVELLSDTTFYGNVLLNTNVEIRTPYIPIQSSIIEGLGFAVFLDGGDVFGDNAGYQFGTYQNAAGGGLRIDTPIGPVRLDYGKRLTNPPAHDWGGVYFAILNMF
jgi:outer membrane protein insertion porin family